MYKVFDTMNTHSLVVKAAGVTIAILWLIDLPGVLLHWQTNLGFLALIHGHTKTAETRFLQVTQQNPNLPGAWHGLGAAKAQQGKTLDAIEAYDQVLALQPAYVVPRYKRAELYIEIGEEQKANLEWRTLNSAQLLIDLGRKAWAAGDNQQAMAFFVMATELDPSNWEAYYLAAFQRYREKRFQESLNWLQRALNRSPHEPTNLLLLQGRNLFALGRYSECEEVITQYIQHLPGEFIGWHWRGICREAQGRLDAAEADFRQAILLEPNDPNPRIYLERLLQRKAEQSSVQ